MAKDRTRRARMRGAALVARRDIRTAAKIRAMRRSMGAITIKVVDQIQTIEEICGQVYEQLVGGDR